MTSLPTGTVTFLFTDIEGSTTLLQRLGDRRYAEVLTEHQRLLRDAFAKGNGQEIDTQGDAFLVAFTRARDAVAAAVAAQRALTNHAWPDCTSLRVRMGLHTGEPLSGEVGYVGIDVHRAARIAAAGHGGQILLSDAVSGLAARDLPPGVSLRDLGTHRLKDLREPEHLLQVVHPDLPADFPPLKSLDARPNNLPRQLTSFIGREKEMAEVKRLLSTSCLVTLTGSGGAGKTRLALQVAADVVEGHPDGVWLAEFAPIADPVMVPKTVASALNVPEQPGGDITTTLVDALRHKALLLVLDNCEHLLSACADLAVALLRACPQVRILATSREGLGVPGETLWRVPSLSLPDAHHLPLPEDLVLYEAVRLFVDRAMATAPGFAVTSENAAAVAHVCQRLDGIPLAIELAAARVKVLAVEQIAARLDDRFRLLTRGSRTALPRQQTLRAAMDWSYDLLSDRERTALRRLSVFSGGWTLEAAEAVCSRGVEAADTVDMLTQLVDKSLVVVETLGTEARYRMLETVRQYGRDRLLESGDSDDVRRRHRDWYLTLAERMEPEFRGPGEEASLERLEDEHENLRVALELSLKSGEIETGLRLAGALWWFWSARGHLSEGSWWLEKTLSGDGGAGSLIRAKALHGAAVLSQSQGGDHKRTRELLDESLALFESLGDANGIAGVTAELGLLMLDQGKHEQATALLEESLTRFRAIGDKSGMGFSLNLLGETVRCRGQYAAARSFYAESLALWKEKGDERGVAVALHNLAQVAVYESAYNVATRLFKESLSLYRKFGYVKGVADDLAGLAEVSEARKQSERAARLLGACQGLLDFIGARISSADRPSYESSLSIVRAALGEERFTAAWAEGRAMTLEQAIEYALGEEAQTHHADH